MHTASPPVAHLDLKPANIHYFPVLVLSSHNSYMCVSRLKTTPSMYFLADFGLGKVMTSTRVLGTASKLARTPGFSIS